MQVYDWRGRRLRAASAEVAADFLAAGYEPMGPKRVIYAIRQPMPRAAALAVQKARGKSHERQYHRIPTPAPTTTTAEGWDNPPRVIKLRPVSCQTRLIFLSALCGRAGALPPDERKRMIEALTAP